MIHNFEWHVPQRLATGSKPSTPIDASWLIQRGFNVILSLEDIPDSVIEFFRQNHIVWCLVKFEGQDENAVISARNKRAREDALDFIELNMIRENIIFVHCSAGINRSLNLAREFLKSYSASCDS